MTRPCTRPVCAVVVTWRPEQAALRALLDAVAPQVGGIVIVDNTPHAEAVDLVLPEHAQWLAQGRNLGLAEAQNIGIAWAQQHDFQYVLLLDQDSVPHEGMVAALLGALERLQRTGRVAAVGPRFHDVREDRDAPFIQVGFPMNRKRWCEPLEQAVACDFLISSGTLVPLAVIDDVGMMDASLFIDNVDLEWSFRARARGYTLYGICVAAMSHRLGEARRALPFGLGQVVVHGPVRLYFMMRNRVRLYGMSHVPRVWVAQDVLRVLWKLLVFSVLVGPRRRNLRFMLRGLCDGVCGRGGACPLVPVA